MIADVRHHLSVAALYGRLSVQRALEYPFSLLSICLGLGFNYVWIGVALKELSARYPVRDVSVQEPDIEDVIRTVYGRDVGG